MISEGYRIRGYRAGDLIYNDTAKRRSTATILFRAKIVHKFDKPFDAFLWHRIVDRCPHAADGSVAAKSAKPDEFGFAAESVGEFFGREPERHVHLRTRFALRSPDVKPVALVDRIVKDIGFRRVS